MEFCRLTAGVEIVLEVEMPPCATTKVKANILTALHVNMIIRAARQQVQTLISHFVQCGRLWQHPP